MTRSVCAAHSTRAVGFAAVLTLLALAAGAAQAQQSDTRRLLITPSISIGETITDNRRNSDGSTGSEAVTTISPGIRLSSRSGRVQGSIDYSLSAIVYARDSSANQVQNRLAASIVAEAVPNHLYVDLRGDISRQSISAFGRQSADPTTQDTNQTEVRTFTISPMLQGTLGGVVGMQARLIATGTNSGTNNISNSTNTTGSVSLGPASAGARLGWSLSASRQISDFERGRRTESDRVVGGLSFAVNSDLRLNARAGKESNDLTTLEKTQYNTYGAGVLWVPTDRTRFAVDIDKRSFGNSHAFSIQHRFRRAVVRFSDSQDISDTSRPLTAFEIYMELYKSQIPDPVQREQIVLILLQRNNIPPNTIFNGGFLRSASTLQRRQEMSIAVQAVRTDFVLSAYTTSSRRADTVVIIDDDVSNSDLKQRGISFMVSHRLTPTSFLNLAITGQKSESVSGNQRSDLRSISATWTEALGRRTNMSLGVRHSVYDGADAYSENAIMANLGMRF